MELFIKLKKILNQLASGAHPLLDRMRSLKQMHLSRSVPLTQVEELLGNILPEKFFLLC